MDLDVFIKPGLTHVIGTYFDPSGPVIKLLIFEAVGIS